LKDEKFRELIESRMHVHLGGVSSPFINSMVCGVHIIGLYPYYIHCLIKDTEVLMLDTFDTSWNVYEGAMLLFRKRSFENCYL
jgi:hypothetical protein